MSPSAPSYPASLQTLGFLERLLPAKVMKKIMLAREKMEERGGAFSPDEKKQLMEEMEGDEMLRKMVGDPRQRVARLLEKEEEDGSEDGGDGGGEGDEDEEEEEEEERKEVPPFR